MNYEAMFIAISGGLGCLLSVGFMIYHIPRRDGYSRLYGFDNWLKIGYMCLIMMTIGLIFLKVPMK